MENVESKSDASNQDRKTDISSTSAFREQIDDEIDAANDPGIESDEEIDGEVDAEGGSALQRRGG